MPEKAAGPLLPPEKSASVWTHADEHLDGRELVGLDDHSLDRRVLVRQFEQHQCDHDVLAELEPREPL
eukprot:5705005-Prymnesium_polylepis.1